MPTEHHYLIMLFVSYMPKPTEQKELDDFSEETKETE